MIKHKNTQKEKALCPRASVWRDKAFPQFSAFAFYGNQSERVIQPQQALDKSAIKIAETWIDFPFIKMIITRIYVAEFTLWHHLRKENIAHLAHYHKL